MKRIGSLSAGMLCLALGAAACGGGGSGTNAAGQAAPVMQLAATTTGSAVLFIPNPSASNAAGGRRAQFVSPSATSLSVSTNGGAATVVNVSSTSPLCTPVTGGRTCTIPLTSAPGVDTFTLNLYDGANGTGNLLGTGTGTTTATVGQPFGVTITLDPVVAAATNPVLTFATGSAFTVGIAGTATASFTLSDPDNNVITLASTPSFSSALQLTSSDPHVTVAPASWTGPAQTVTLTYDGSAAVGATVNVLLKSGSTTLATATTTPVSGFIATVTQTAPLAYYRLTGASGSSVVGPSTYTLTGSAAPSMACAPVNVPNNQCLVLDGLTGYFNTTQMGGITTAGSIMAWVNLSELPSTANRILYVAGISQFANDFDVQYESDNNIRFYTAAGGPAGEVAYAPPLATLAGNWHMIVATFSTITATRAIYYDGVLGTLDTTSGGLPNKTGEFAIGESTVFPGRFFPGSITDVALWNYALTAQSVAAIYASR
jgi:hypothetical protein